MEKVRTFSSQLSRLTPPLRLHVFDRGEGSWRSRHVTGGSGTRSRPRSSLSFDDEQSELVQLLDKLS
jgi:hypothetical protein